MHTENCPDTIWVMLKHLASPGQRLLCLHEAVACGMSDVLLLRCCGTHCAPLTLVQVVLGNLASAQHSKAHDLKYFVQTFITAPTAAAKGEGKRSGTESQAGVK
jgi:hypothetical protein